MAYEMEIFIFFKPRLTVFVSLTALSLAAGCACCNTRAVQSVPTYKDIMYFIICGWASGDSMHVSRWLQPSRVGGLGPSREQ